MATHDANLADADAEMVGYEFADGNIGLVGDWGGYDADYETARSIPAHLVAASPGDHSYLETLIVYTHARTYVPGRIPGIHLCSRGGRYGRASSREVVWPATASSSSSKDEVARPTSVQFHDRRGLHPSWPFELGVARATRSVAAAKRRSGSDWPGPVSASLLARRAA